MEFNRLVFRWASGANISNIGFHAPPQEPGWANDGTDNNQGYSSTPWDVTQTANSITWSTETFAQNQNANAIRWGTLYNFRFDADQPPQAGNATIGFFKTGSPMTVAVQGPAAGATPTPTPLQQRQLPQHRLRLRGLLQHPGLVHHRDLAPLLCLVHRILLSVIAEYRSEAGGTRSLPLAYTPIALRAMHNELLKSAALFSIAQVPSRVFARHEKVV